MRTRSEPVNVSASRSLARGVVARYLKLALEAPTPESFEELSSSDAGDALRGAALIRAGTVETAEAILRSRPSSLEELARNHDRLFGHSLRGRVCPYETEYGKREPLLQAQELSDIVGFYRAFGLEPSTKLLERWDHIAVELEFVELLSMKEAYALESHDEEMFEVTRLALRRFVKEHLGFFGRALATNLDEEDSGGFYGSVGALLSSFLAALSRELDLRPGPRTLPLCSTEDDGVPMACGDGGSGPAEIPAFDV